MTLRLSGRRGIRYGCVLVAIALLVTAPVIAATGTTRTSQTESQLPEPGFTVALDANVSARLTLAVTFDLTTESERTAFESLRENTTAREQRTDRFATRLRAIAASTENTTGRAMTIRAPGITFLTRDETGFVVLSATWTGLAAQEGDRVVLREPFDSGFDVNRQFRVVAPDGYELDSVRPSPTTQSRTGATWGDGTTLDGFEVAFVPNATGTDDGHSAAGPGFGIGTAVIAVLASTAALLSRRRA